MMQSLLVVTTKVKDREVFRRPQQTSPVPFNQPDRTLHKLAPDQVYSRSHRTAIVSAKRISSLSIASTPPQKIGTQTDVRYPVPGSNLVESIRYAELAGVIPTGRVWINQVQYFEGVPPNVWNFSLAGKLLCQNWLQERKGSTLTDQSIQHYQRMVTILKDVVTLMIGIDAVLQKQSLATA